MTVDQSFIVAIPYPITDSILTSHSVAESEPAWNSGTTYAIDDQVKYGSNHDLFSSKQNSNLNQVPVKYPDETAYWFELLVESSIVPNAKLADLRDECDQLLAIFTTISKKAKANAS